MPKELQSHRHFQHRVVKSILQREHGFPKTLGSDTKFASSLYSTLYPNKSWSQENTNCKKILLDHGAVFNLEFSTDGSLLVAACERKSVLMFDPLCQKLIHAVENAHSDCVNCVRFLDSRTFATCSDDTTVILWDARNLKQKIRTLRGHANWVKNIEYSCREGLLVTSGFDGSIFTWDINGYTEEGLLYNRIFHTNGLMRMKLNPDATKMVICTTGGYLMVIHDLDLSALSFDLTGFKPNMYRLMQLSNTSIPVVSNFTRLFKTTRNRVEFISDFPKGNDAEVISSLQMHPQGWCALSRNTSGDELTEWTCVHDIQEDPSPLRFEESDPDISPKDVEEEPVTSSTGTLTETTMPEILTPETASSTPQRSLTIEATPTNQTQPSYVQFQMNFSGTLAAQNERSTQTSRFSNVELHFASPSVFEALEVIREARRRQYTNGTPIEQTLTIDLENRPNNAYFIRTDSNGATRTVLLVGSGRTVCNRTAIPENHKIHENQPRLLNYIKEPNVGRGFIKELCFSADGRIIFSPFENGIRMLSFNPDCYELSNCVQNKPTMLHEIAHNYCHNNVVVSTKFSPTHCLLVSGCLNGKIFWHQPNI